MTRQAEKMDKNQGMTGEAEKSREQPDRLKKVLNQSQEACAIATEA